ncbi:MAG: YggS family pyridoxal phosphate enzyme [Nitrospirae bacterium RBG_16_64_22]|nr:MAG: YggS family pyridoxal phosphate enzyme [Nitrospirae bacterium RBG_16_64_22]
MREGEGIAERLARARERIAAAAGRAGRDPARVKLMAVTKTVPAERVREAAACGQMLFGENRVQEAADKIPAVGPGPKWHMIGRLQTNKVKAAVRLFDCVESVDSIRLAEILDRAARESGKVLPIFVEVNIGGEAQKSGALPGDVERLLDLAAGLASIRVTGLMAIPPYSLDPEEARPYFRRMYDLCARLRERGFGLDDLSMGMSGDFEAAVEEGATIVRLGTVLFGVRGDG